MKLPRHAKIFRGQLDVAPFMGVFLLLLLFVMFQQQITFVPGIPVNMPEATDLSGVQGPAVAIVVDAQGQIYFDNRLLNQSRPDELRRVLQRALENAGQPVTLILRADREVPYGTLMDLNLAAREAGIHDVLLVTKPQAPAEPQ